MKVPLGLKKIAAMVVLRCQDQYLLLQRAKEPNKGMYLPVGGKLEPYESPIQAAIRETLEETGIVIVAPKFCGTLIETSPNSYNWMSYIYLADIPFQEAPDCAEGKLAWIKEGELELIPTPPTDWHVYQYIQKNQHFALSAIYDESMNLLEMREEMSNQNLI